MNILRPSKPLVCAAALTAMAALVPAGKIFNGNPVASPGHYSDATFGEIIAGEFTGDLGLDVVVMDDGIPTLCMTPEVYRTHITWSGGVANDIVAMPTSSGPDRLFVSSVDGLYELVWSESTGVLTTTTIDESEWDNVRALAVGDFDGDGDLDIAGLDGNDSKGVLVKYNDGSGGFLTTSGSYATTGDNSQLVAVDWDGDGDDEIFCITSIGVEGDTHLGAYVDEFLWTGTVDLMAVLDEIDPNNSSAPLAEQGLALIVQGTTGPQYIQVWTEAGFEPARSLGPRHAVAIDATDSDGDHDSDLVLGLDSGLNLIYIPAYTDSQKANPSDKRFSAPFSTIPFGDPARDPADNQAGVVVADFDHDGNTEIVAPSQGSWGTGWAPGAQPYSELWFHDLDTSAEQDLQSVVVETSLEVEVSSPGDVTHRISVTIPSTLLTPGSTEEVKLQFTLWDTEDYGEATNPRPLFVHLEDPVSELEDGLVHVELEETGSTFSVSSALYTWVVRQVIVDNGVVLQRGPATVAVCAGEDNLDYLQFLGTPVAGISHTINVGGGTEDVDGGVSVGGTIPEPEPQEPPNEDPPEEENPRQTG